MRKTLVHPARNGWFYVFDRATGEMILKPWPFVFTDVITGVDMETGRALYDIRKIMFTKLEDRQKYVPDAKDTNVTWCPGIAARNWFQDAYSPRTGLIYTPAYNQCYTQKVLEGKYNPPADYTLREQVGQGIPAPGTNNAGELQANDPVTGKTVWRVPWKTTNNTPVMATAGDLLFQGGANEGVFRALNAKTGEIVWSFRTGSNFRSSPISYQGPDGRQYIAIISSQLGANTQVKADMAADADARFRRSGATLYVFALPRAAARR
jgi:alcohol dehydrogenase (cytochrome c)